MAFKTLCLQSCKRKRLIINWHFLIFLGAISDCYVGFRQWRGLEETLDSTCQVMVVYRSRFICSVQTLVLRVYWWVKSEMNIEQMLVVYLSVEVTSSVGNTTIRCVYYKHLVSLNIYEVSVVYPPRVDALSVY